VKAGLLFIEDTSDPHSSISNPASADLPASIIEKHGGVLQYQNAGEWRHHLWHRAGPVDL
jgi:hypothetical protein